MNRFSLRVMQADTHVHFLLLIDGGLIGGEQCLRPSEFVGLARLLQCRIDTSHARWYKGKGKEVIDAYGT